MVRNHLLHYKCCAKIFVWITYKTKKRLLWCWTFAYVVKQGHSEAVVSEVSVKPRSRNEVCSFRDQRVQLPAVQRVCVVQLFVDPSSRKDNQRICEEFTIIWRHVVGGGWPFGGAELLVTNVEIGEKSVARNTSKPQPHDIIPRFIINFHRHEYSS